MAREPWVKVKIGARRSAKLAQLPSDSARLGYFYLLLEAKVQRDMGVFEGRAHFVDVMGRFGRYVPDYLRVEVLHEAPVKCAECRDRYGALRRGQLVVHDFLREQRDPTAADRMAGYRERWRDDHSDGGSDGDVTDSVTPPVTPIVTPPVTPTVTGTDTGDSRARATTVTVTDSLLQSTTEKRRGSRNRSSREAKGERADIAALLERGWKQVTAGQRAVLDEVLGRHDVTGPEFAAEVIRNTPPDDDPLQAVMKADALWQQSQRQRADSEEEAWQDAKAQERLDAARIKREGIQLAEEDDVPWLTGAAT